MNGTFQIKQAFTTRGDELVTLSGEAPKCVINIPWIREMTPWTVRMLGTIPGVGMAVAGLHIYHVIKNWDEMPLVAKVGHFFLAFLRFLGLGGIALGLEILGDKWDQRTNRFPKEFLTEIKYDSTDKHES